jgi:hypothetical protein
MLGRITAGGQRTRSISMNPGQFWHVLSVCGQITLVSLPWSRLLLLVCEVCVGLDHRGSSGDPHGRDAGLPAQKRSSLDAQDRSPRHPYEELTDAQLVETRANNGARFQSACLPGPVTVVTFEDSRSQIIDRLERRGVRINRQVEHIRWPSGDRVLASSLN